MWRNILVVEKFVRVDPSVGGIDYQIIKRVIRLQAFLAILIWMALMPVCADADAKLKDMNPLIVSYFWPVAKGSRDFKKWDMETPNVLDVLSSESHGSQEVKNYWMGKGKIILHRVYPKKFKTSEAELYKYFAEEMRNADGISIDEFVSGRFSNQEIDISIRVLGRLKKTFPDKYIFAWASSSWDARSVSLLKGIRDSCDVFIPQLYFSEAYRVKHGLYEMRRRVEKIEEQAPGIMGKTVIGISVHSKMDDMKEIDIKDHMRSQIEYIKKDPVLNGLRGLGIYAPCYLSVGNQRYLDKMIRSHYFAP